MRCQRGFGLLAYLIAAAAVLGALYALVQFVDASWETSAGVAKGKADQDAEYARRDNQALRDAIHARERMQQEKEAIEQRNAALVGAASTAYQEGLSHGKKDVDDAVRRVHAGYRLRDPGRTAAAAECAAGAAAAPDAGAGRRDGEAGAELSAAASEFLLRIAGEADDVVRQLTACQAVVAADREGAK